MSKRTVEYNHNPFVVNRRAFVFGGPNDLAQYDFVDDRKQGFGVPAQSLVVRNIGGGVGGDYLHLQYAEKKQHFCPEVSLYEGEKFVVTPEDGVRIAYAILWGDSASLAFTLVATPGIWDFESLLRAGYIKSKEAVIDDSLMTAVL